MKKLSCILVSVFAFVTACRGATFEVGTFSELTNALYLAQSNTEHDVINVQPGTYVSSPKFTYASSEDKSLTIQNAGGGEVVFQGYDGRTLWIQTTANSTNADVTLSGITIRDGRVFQDFGGNLLLRTQWGDITLENCRIINGTSSHIFFQSNAGGAFIRAESKGTITLCNNVFSNNLARGIGGGAYVKAAGTASIVMRNNLFVDNEGSTCGGGTCVEVLSGSILLENNTLTDNETGFGDGGGGVYVNLYFDSASLEAYNNIVWTNVAGIGFGEDFYVEDDGDGNGTGAVVQAFFNNAAHVDFTVGDNVTEGGNSATNPLFAADFSLQAGSPCIDTGTNRVTVTNDLYGIPRPLDGDTNGTAIMDMGAFERPDPNADSDGDTMPDLWEIANGLNATVNDAAGDPDADSLTNSAEYVWGTDPQNPDTDGDGMTDGYEVANGFDPLRGDASIQGTVSYAGSQTGIVYVAVFTNSDFGGDPFVEVGLAAPGAYAITNLFSNTYYVASILVTITQTEFLIKRTDPWGTHGPYTNPTAVIVGPTQNVMGIDFSITDGTPANPNPFASLRPPCDFDRDSASDIAVWNTQNGLWQILASSQGATQAFNNTSWGMGSDIPLAADYDGDGLCDLAVWRPGSGDWWILQSSGGYVRQPWGRGSLGDVPVPGDYDGDGFCDIAVWRQGSGDWWIRRSTDSGVTKQGWGMNGDIPVPGDYDGDGLCDVAVWRRTTGDWWIRRSTDSGVTKQSWGMSGDVPVPGDYDGDGLCDIAVWRPGSGDWWIRRSTDSGVTKQSWGMSGDVPVPGDYDGDGLTDFAIYRPGNSTWYVILSGSGVLVQTWGSSATRPVLPQYQINRRFGLLP